MTNSICGDCEKLYENNRFSDCINNAECVKSYKICLNTCPRDSMAFFNFTNDVFRMIEQYMEAGYDFQLEEK
ncbi:hypothetical protein SNEBB_000864 [Seison nebaliae]|nr:hypothetical protein SNEBB_000864 [Seison nebaliae]